MTCNEDMARLLKKLRLSGVLQSLDLRTRQAADDDLSHVEYLTRLLTDEVERREAKQLDLRLRRASFEHDKTLEDFDFRFNPKMPKAKVLDLANCTFIQRQENVLLCGPTGVGKSHIAQALGHRACRAGHSVLCVAAGRMLTDLRAARADNSMDRRIARYTNPELLIIDDLGLRPLKSEEAEDLYEVIRLRYERGSMIISSNRAIDEWLPLFGDPLMASAALDRLLHHAHVITIDGDSYRNPPPKRGASKKQKDAAEAA